MINILQQLFEQYTCQPIVTFNELASSGSNRRYFRITSKDRVLIGTIGNSIDENRAFIGIAKHFHSQGLPVPQVCAVSDDYSCYLQEDLGDITLFNSVSSGRESGVYSPEEVTLLKKTMAMLPSLQFKGAEGLDFSLCYPQPEFDKRMVSFDLNYFKYCFLMATGLSFSEVRLDEDFNNLCKVLMSTSFATFLYRDFQARNVMLVDGEPYFIDFQGGRKGPIYYDVASFVWQAKANYSQSLREELIETYLEALKKYMPVDKKFFYSQLRHFVLFRTLQVLGAYGFRGYFEKKPHFLQSVPFALDNIRHLLKEPFTEYPYLSSILSELIELPQFKFNESHKLEVKIYSFAYKKGIPEDTSGNGGGYVFDCRGINNPGKYEHYRHFTGMDKEVIDFLEKGEERDGKLIGAGEATRFLESVYTLADAHVAKYIERKFTNLMFCFGCTGGQHRSVYCAERLAEHISRKFDVRVTLCHREQNVEKTF